MIKAKKGLGKTGYTQRGFARVEFKDINNISCSLQQSSLATDDAIWLGCNEANTQYFVPYEGWKPVPIPSNQGVVANTRMHLNREGVEALIVSLQRWLKKGTF